MSGFELICFDADDTLWENESFYRITEATFVELLKDFAEPEDLSNRLTETERRNLRRYGYGIKGFTLSMIETALEVTNGSVPQSVISDILKAGRELLQHPLDLIEGAQEVLEQLHGTYPLALVTKGDLFDQERKLAQSGLADLFDRVEIVSEKSPHTYSRIFSNQAEASMMVGNSMKSDVLPAIEAGGWGVHVPHDLEWVLEAAEAPVHSPKFRKITDLSELPDLIETVTSN